MVAGYGAVWVSNPAENTIQKVAPRLGRVVATTVVGRGPRYLTAGAGSIWTLNEIDGSITRVDPHTSRRQATIPAALAGAGGDVVTADRWLYARSTTTLLTRVDSRTNRVVARYRPTNGGGGASIVAFGALWISAERLNTVWRLPLAGAS